MQTDRKTGCKRTLCERSRRQAAMFNFRWFGRQAAMNRLAGCQMRSDALEGGEGYPAVVVADLDVGVVDVAVLYSAPMLCPCASHALLYYCSATAVLRLASQAPLPRCSLQASLLRHRPALPLPLPQRLLRCSRLCYDEPFQRFRLCYDEPLSMFPAMLRRTVTINYLISFYTTIIHPIRNRLAPFSFKTSPISTTKGASYNTQRLAPFTIQNHTTCSFLCSFLLQIFAHISYFLYLCTTFQNMYCKLWKSKQPNCCEVHKVGTPHPYPTTRLADPNWW